MYVGGTAHSPKKVFECIYILIEKVIHIFLSIIDQLMKIINSSFRVCVCVCVLVVCCTLSQAHEQTDVALFCCSFFKKNCKLLFKLLSKVALTRLVWNHCQN